MDQVLNRLGWDVVGDALQCFDEVLVQVLIDFALQAVSLGLCKFVASFDPVGMFECP